MEDDVFPHSAVAELLEPGFVEARLHNDHPEQGEANRALQTDRVGYVAAPVYMVIDPATRSEVARQTLQGYGTNTEAAAVRFAEFLRQASGE